MVAEASDAARRMVRLESGIEAENAFERVLRVYRTLIRETDIHSQATLTAYLDMAIHYSFASQMVDIPPELREYASWATRWVAQSAEPSVHAIPAHIGSITAMTLQRVGGRTMLATGGTDRTIRLWDAVTGHAYARPLTGHTSPITALAMGVDSANRPLLISGSEDAEIRTWDLRTGMPLGRPRRAGMQSVTDLEISYIRNRTVVASTSDRMVRVWDVESDKPVHGPLSLSARAGSITSATLNETSAAAISYGNEIGIWDLESGRRGRQRFTGHSGAVNAIASVRISARPVVVSASEDGSVRLWDPESGFALAPPIRWQGASIERFMVQELHEQLFGVAISGNRARRFNLENGSTLDADVTHDAPISALAVGIINDTAVAMTSDLLGCFKTWAIDSGIELPLDVPLPNSPITLIATLTLGNTTQVYSTDGHQLVVWEPKTGLTLARTDFRGRAPISAMTPFDLSGRPALVVADGSTAFAIDPLSGDPIGQRFTLHRELITSLAVGDVDGRMLVVSGGGDTEVRAWDALTAAEIVGPLGGTLGWVRALSLVRSGRDVRAFAGGLDNSIRVWDLRTGQPKLQAFSGHTGSVTALEAVVMDDQVALVSSSLDNTVRFWDPYSGDELEPKLPVDGRTTTAFTSLLINQNQALLVGKERTLRLWDVATRRPIGPPLTAPSLGVAAATAVDGGVNIYSGGTDGRLNQWHVAESELVRAFEGHEGSVTAVDTYRTGSTMQVVSAGADASVRVWDLDSGTRIGAAMLATAGITALAVDDSVSSPEVATGDMDGRVQYWDIAAGARVGPSPVTSHDDWVTALLVVRIGDRRLSLSGSKDGTLHVVDLASRVLRRRTVNAHSDGVSALKEATVKERRVVLSGGADGLLRWWDPLSCQELRSQGGFEGGIHAISIAPSASGDVALVADDEFLWAIDVERGTRLHRERLGSIVSIDTRRRDRSLVVATARSAGQVDILSMGVSDHRSDGNFGLREINLGQPVSCVVISGEDTLICGTDKGLTCLNIDLWNGAAL